MRHANSTLYLGAGKEPTWRDSLYLRSEDGESAEWRLAMQLAALQVKRQPKPADAQEQSIDPVPGGSRRGSVRRCEPSSRRSSDAALLLVKIRRDLTVACIFKRPAARGNHDHDLPWLSSWQEFRRVVCGSEPHASESHTWATKSS